MTTNKLNFAALKTNNAELNKDIEEKISPPKEVKEIKTEETKAKPIVQVSLWKKKDIVLIEKKEEKKVAVPEEKKLDLETGTKVNKIEKTEEVKKWDKNPIQETENLFHNYESDFSSKQDSIIDKLKKIKDLPKTRPKIVYWMLFIMIIGVSGIIFISPNDSLIKASILWVEQEKVVPVQNNLSEIAKNKALELQKKAEKERKEKIKKEKIENFLLNKNKKSDNLPNKNNNDIKNKSKNKKLKDLLLEAKKNK